MTAKETITILLHGANQAKREEADNIKVWQNALDLDSHSQRVRGLIEGQCNDEVAKHHQRRHSGCDYPAFSGWTAPWYGNVWERYGSEQYDTTLIDGASAEIGRNERSTTRNLVEYIERKKLEKHFDELVPFYELAVADDGKTLYEHVCDRVVDQLVDATKGGKNYMIIAHSMGCAVSYNVLSHISCEKEGQSYCPKEGTLSSEYRAKIADFANSGSDCFGLMTFGNYTAYNWCQRLNNIALFDENKPLFVFPEAAGRWFNFWTRLGGDPYIIDDQLEEDMVGDEDNDFEDVAVSRIPFSKIGHGRDTWFDRNKFAKRLFKKAAFHCYR